MESPKTGPAERAGTAVLGEDARPPRANGAAGDLLSELLQPLRLTGFVDSRPCLRAPWTIDRAAVERCAVLHYVTRGGCWLTAEGRAPIRLRAGDLAVLPTGTAHRLRDRPGVANATAPGRPGGLAHGHGHGHGDSVEPGASMEPGEASGTRGAGGAESSLLCAGLRYGESASTGLHRALPWVLVLDGPRVDADPLLRDTLRLLAAPDRPTGPGDRLVTLRAFEMALVLAMRQSLRELAEDPSGLPVLRHPGVSRAAAIIATRFAEPWTIESLAREVGMSRSAFTAAFRELVGEAPARHLTARRMQEAARLLGETPLPQSAVPQRVGYQSAVGFHLAFRKWFGRTPGEYRASCSSAA